MAARKQPEPENTGPKDGNRSPAPERAPGEVLRGIAEEARQFVRRLDLEARARELLSERRRLKESPAGGSEGASLHSNRNRLRGVARKLSGTLAANDFKRLLARRRAELGKALLDADRGREGAAGSGADVDAALVGLSESHGLEEQTAKMVMRFSRRGKAFSPSFEFDEALPARPRPEPATGQKGKDLSAGEEEEYTVGDLLTELFSGDGPSEPTGGEYATASSIATGTGRAAPPERAERKRRTRSVSVLYDARTGHTLFMRPETKPSSRGEGQFASTTLSGLRRDWLFREWDTEILARMAALGEGATPGAFARLRGARQVAHIARAKGVPEKAFSFDAPAARRRARQAAEMERERSGRATEAARPASSGPEPPDAGRGPAL